VAWGQTCGEVSADAKHCTINEVQLGEGQFTLDRHVCVRHDHHATSTTSTRQRDFGTLFEGDVCIVRRRCNPELWPDCVYDNCRVRSSALLHLLQVQNGLLGPLDCAAVELDARALQGGGLSDVEVIHFWSADEQVEGGEGRDLPFRLHVSSAVHKLRLKSTACSMAHV
jgi:hypothetical protein